jgi:hypothetical protein
MYQSFKIAELEKEGVVQIENLEKELGFHIMAYEPDGEYATPSEQQLNQIQGLEKELGVTLVAYKA